MVRFRHLALILLFLSPAAADEIPLDGSAFLGDEDCAGGQSPGRMHAKRAFS
jgi:hypothetical protein